jgi:hypothetical protein
MGDRDKEGKGKGGPVGMADEESEAASDRHCEDDMVVREEVGSSRLIYLRGP